VNEYHASKTGFAATSTLAIQSLTPQTNFHFSELKFHLKRLPQNEKAPTAKLPALF
jgi:hypothetical protein